MSKPYDIEVHKHRLAAWAASSAASASPKCRFKVEQGVAILKACGFDASFSSPDKLPEPDDLDRKHRGWREKAIRNAGMGSKFTHGVAAKLINVYLKVRFVCGGHHLHERVKALHPPIDSVLLATLARSELVGCDDERRSILGWRWSEFDSVGYQKAIDLVRRCCSRQPLWMIEKHWVGYR